MTETTKRRRRWPWLVLAVGMLLVGGQLAWRFRPLNATEKLLVGKWGGTNPDVVVYHFHRDRRFTSLTTSGSWRASPGLLTLERDPFDSQGHPLQDRLEICFRRILHPRQCTLKFDGPDQLFQNRLRLQRIRD